VSTRKALCVGINVYKNYPGSSLQGCVNDVDDMVDLLKKHLGFTEKDIVTLKDGQATKANIMKNLKEMVDGAKSGKYSYLVYSHSGHGTQVPDLSGDEPDRADEAFCPHDLATRGSRWSPDHIITDDELHDLFVQLPKDTLLEVFLDTCHSGTGLKAADFLLDRRPRYMPPPSWEAFEQLRDAGSRGLYDSLLEKGIIHHILWAGCRYDQTSADALIDGKWHGAFTYCFCQAMEANSALPRKDILKKARSCLKKGNFTQVAQLETQATKRKAKMG
jgi:hypothetical protein